MAEYDRWRARRELLGTTLRSAAGAVPLALQQRATPGRGVNFLRYAPGSGLSMGEVGDLLHEALQASGRAVEPFALTVRSASTRPAAGGTLHPSTVALVQSGHVPTAVAQLPRLFSPRRSRAAVVHYELPQVPPAQRLALPFVDELWTTSEFVRDAFSDLTRKPVRVLPLPVRPPRGVPGALREHLGLGGAFVFGYQFDLVSSGERKHPAAVARAYLHAFPRPEPGVRLLLKAVHADSSPRVWAEVQGLVAGRPDVLLVDAWWPRELVEAFFLDVDCYVSLHRAEGYGLTLAQAMAAGTPVVATGYSGNLTFMTEDTAVLVPWRQVRVGPDPVYPPSGTWAEPDVEAAAQALRRLASDPEAARALGERGRAHVLGTCTLERTASWLDEVLPG